MEPESRDQNLEISMAEPELAEHETIDLGSAVYHPQSPGIKLLPHSSFLAGNCHRLSTVILDMGTLPVIQANLGHLGKMYFTPSWSASTVSEYLYRCSGLPLYSLT